MVFWTNNNKKRLKKSLKGCAGKKIDKDWTGQDWMRNEIEKFWNVRIQDLTKFDKIQQDLTRFYEICQYLTHLTRFDKIWSDLTRFNKIQ